jgi:ADP-ribosyl-[dinitrogen reductase] hydrolase
LLAGEHPGGSTRDKTKDRLKKLLAAGIECFVDLTKPTELLRYDTQLPFYVEYTRKAIKDHGLPGSREQMAEILDYVGNAMRAGRPVYVHCRAGIGRTGTVIGCLLVERGLSGDGALDELNRLWQQSKRSKSWAFVPETEEQADYVRQWKPSLKNGGVEMSSLVSAVAALGPMSAVGESRPGALGVGTVQSRAASQATGAGQARAAMQNLAAGKGRTVGKTSGTHYAGGGGLAAAAAQARAAVERGEGANQTAGAGFANGAGLSAAASRARAAADLDKASQNPRVAEKGSAAGTNGASPDGTRAGRASADVPAGRGILDSASLASPAGTALASPSGVVPTSTDARPFAALLDPAEHPTRAMASRLPAASTAETSPAATALGSPPLPRDEVRPFAALLESAGDSAAAVASRPATAGMTMAPPRTPASSPESARVALSPAIDAAAPLDPVSPVVSSQAIVAPSSVVPTPSAVRAPPGDPAAGEPRPADFDPLLDTATLVAARALRERFVGTLFGLAVGDAVAAATQFRRAGSFSPLGDMIGGGPFDLPRGAWSDDTAMALCLAESLLECDGFDPRDQVQRYARWQQEGYLSCTGQCVGITANTARSLALAKWRRVVFPGSFDPEQLDPEPLSRIAPIALYYLSSLETTLQQAADSSRTTCQAPAVLDACRQLGRALNAALSGQPKARILANVTPITEAAAHTNNTAATALAAALWAFSSTDNFRDAVLRAANVGGNSDVVASVCGQLAGAHYGMSAIPSSWLNGLMQKDMIEGYADRLLAHGLVSLSG